MKMHLLNDTSSSNEQFYARLPINQIPLDEILLKNELFFAVSGKLAYYCYRYFVTDIKVSTDAVPAGYDGVIN